jgi:DNA-binding MarR family transcriptional regulator
MRDYFSKDKYFKTWWLLHQARDTVFRVRSRELSQYGITTEQAAVLFIVKVLSKLKRKSTPGEISKWILREPHSVSKILTRMEKQGYVSKANGLGRKKNEVHIALTKKGEQAYKHSMKRESIRELMSCLSEEERQQLSSLLEKIRGKALQDLTKRNTVFFP